MIQIIGLSFANAVCETEPDIRQALLKACPIRIRPILMTSFSTIAAAVPPALALGPGAETRIPMAITVIGGVAVSTLLTLFVAPCVYSLLTRFERKRPNSYVENQFESNQHKLKEHKIIKK